MKRPSLTTIAVLLTSLQGAWPVNFTFNLGPPAGCVLVGSQTYDSGTVFHTLDSYFSGCAEEGDTVYFFDAASQNYTAATYFDMIGWLGGSIPPFFPGQGLVYQKATPSVISTCTLADNSVAPVPVTVLADNKFYLRSSQKPVVAGYGELVGQPGALPLASPKRTFVYRLAGSQWVVSRYANSQWKPAPPSIPIGEAAFMIVVNPPGPTPAPMLDCVQVVGVSCAPSVKLRLTFAPYSATALLDPVTAAIPANYQIFKGGTSTSGGSVNSVTVEQGVVVAPCAALEPSFCGTGGIAFSSVLLDVTLLTEPGNTYDVKAPGVKNLGGVASLGMQSFTLCSGSPPNDTPASASALTSGTTVYGSLMCAGPTAGTILASYPPSSGAAAKDIWHKFEAAVSGPVTVETCQPLLSSCPNAANTVLAVYRGSPAALEANPSKIQCASGAGNEPWYNNDQNTACSTLAPCALNVKASRVKFQARACATYYIRVSALNSGPLPGEFALLLSQVPDPPANDCCSSSACGTGATPVSANSSTVFDNFLAGTDGPASESVFNDVWFRFTAPPGAVDATVETCTANFNCALAVYSGGCGALALVLGAYDTGVGCSPGSKVTFPVTPNATYRVRVGGVTASDRGCGSVRITSGIPGLNTVPTGAFNQCKTYKIYGNGNGIGWSWKLTAPAAVSTCLPNGLNVGDNNVNGVNGTAFNVAEQFRDSINLQLPGSATALPVGGSVAQLKICMPCSGGTVVLKVGAFGSTPACWVVNLPPGLAVGFPPCNFNPGIYEIADPNDPDADCNGNGQSDYADIVTGFSADVDADFVPDECQACVPAVVVDDPASVETFIGGTAGFKVQTAGKAPLSYQWRKDGAPLPGEIGASLSLNNVSADAGGAYDVVVSNACGEASSAPARLSVSPLPGLIITRAGSKAVLSWSDPDYRLQSTQLLGSGVTWSDVPGSSGVEVSIGPGNQFFRLVNP